MGYLSLPRGHQSCPRGSVEEWARQNVAASEGALEEV